MGTKVHEGHSLFAALQRDQNALIYRGTRKGKSLKIITYVPDYQLILTRRCALACGYCNFPNTASVLPPSKKQLQRMLRLALRVGANQITLTAGEGIDELPEIVSACRYYGFRSWHDYLRNLCGLILNASESHVLLPQLDVGALPPAELPKLRSTAPSVRLMLHSADDSLMRKPAHSHAPHKHPQQRLGALEELGRSRIATVTGLTVGIGEAAASWGRAARVVSELQRRYHHIRAFVLKPFFPMQFSPMAQCPPVSDETLLQAIQEVRKELDESICLVAKLQQRMHLAVPAIQAGANDLGPFHLANSERIDFDLPPAIERLRQELADNNVQLCARVPFFDAETLGHSVLSPNAVLKIRSLKRLPGNIVLAPPPTAC